MCRTFALLLVLAFSFDANAQFQITPLKPELHNPQLVTGQYIVQADPTASAEASSGGMCLVGRYGDAKKCKSDVECYLAFVEPKSSGVPRTNFLSAEAYCRGYGIRADGREVQGVCWYKPRKDLTNGWENGACVRGQPLALGDKRIVASKARPWGTDQDTWWAVLSCQSLRTIQVNGKPVAGCAYVDAVEEVHKRYRLGEALKLAK